MRKLYLFLLFVTAFSLYGTHAHAQGECDNTADLITVINDANGTIAPGGSNLQLCGTPNEAMFISLQYDDNAEATAGLTIVVISTTTPGVPTVTQLEPGTPLALEADNTYVLQFTLNSPVEEQTFILSLLELNTMPFGIELATAAITVMGQPAPVEFASFAGRSTDKTIDLDWSTASESGNSGFEVQRSADGSEWHDLTFVPTAVDGNTGSDYGFVDQSPLNGASYYRLMQVDFDGSFDYSPVVEVNFVPANALQVYPNPAHNSVNVRLADDGGTTYRAVITDRVGRTILERTISGADALDVNALETGIYQLSILTDSGLLTQRFVKN